jgi:hypothetical protein
MIRKYQAGKRPRHEAAGARQAANRFQTKRRGGMDSAAPQLLNSLVQG